MGVTSIATGASLNTRPDVPPAGGTSTTTQPLNAPSRHSNCCAHTHSASGLFFLAVFFRPGGGAWCDGRLAGCFLAGRDCRWWCPAGRVGSRADGGL